ncbi:MAG: ATPase, T2SS/T4P/T4SS family [Infirmifilum sp.]
MKLSLSFLKNKKKGDETIAKVAVNTLLPEGAKIILKNHSGFLFSYDSKLEILPLKTHPVWKNLSPLFMAREVEEIWVFESRTVVTIKNLGRISIEGLPSKDELEDIIVSIIASTGLKVDMRRPRGVVDVDEWRVSVQLTSGGQTQIVATRLSSIPPLKNLLDPLTAARMILLLLRPSVVVILGPPGSGKTTLLNSIVGEVGKMYPHLHIAVIEKYKELTLREGWFSWIVSENLVEGVRWAMRYYRPDMVVIGEIMAEDFWSVIEPSRSGLPTITTFHSPSIRKAIKILSDSLRAQLGYGDESSALQYIDVFVQTFKRVTPQGVERGVENILLSDGQRLIPIYSDGQAAPKEIFEKALPDQLYVGSTAKTMREIFQRYGLTPER